MTQITVFGNCLARFRFEGVVMAPEAALGLHMTNVLGISIIPNLHEWEGILAERFLN
jgi:hypothetical protein